MSDFIFDNPGPMGDTWDITRERSGDEFRADRKNTVAFVHAKAYGDAISVMGKTTAGKTIRRTIPLNEKAIGKLLSVIRSV
jgi:hypothetical protein